MTSIKEDEKCGECGSTNLFERFEAYRDRQTGNISLGDECFVQCQDCGAEVSPFRLHDKPSHKLGHCPTCDQEPGILIEVWGGQGSDETNAETVYKCDNCLTSWTETLMLATLEVFPRPK